MIVKEFIIFCDFSFIFVRLLLAFAITTRFLQLERVNFLLKYLSHFALMKKEKDTLHCIIVFSNFHGSTRDDANYFFLNLGSAIDFIISSFVLIEYVTKKKVSISQKIFSLCPAFLSVIRISCFLVI